MKQKRESWTTDLTDWCRENPSGAANLIDNLKRENAALVRQNRELMDRVIRWRPRADGEVVQKSGHAILVGFARPVAELNDEFYLLAWDRMHERWYFIATDELADGVDWTHWSPLEPPLL